MRMRSSTGAATRAVRSDIDRKPANSAARASETPSASGLARDSHASAGEQRGQQRWQPQDWLPVGGQIERDAAHRRDGQPKEEAPLLDLARQRASERSAPIRRPRRGAGEPGGGGKSASARGSGHERARLTPG